MNEPADLALAPAHRVGRVAAAGARGGDALMIVGLDQGLADVRRALLGDLVKAVASGKRRDARPEAQRVEVRPVLLKGELHLQVTRQVGTQALTHNVSATEREAAVDALLAEPYGNWHVESGGRTWQLRVTKRGEAQLHVADGVSAGGPATHDRPKQHRVGEASPLWRALGVADAAGVIKPSRRSKLRQVEEFVRLLEVAVAEARASGALREPTDEKPWRLVDLGCGNAYLTFAALSVLSEKWPVVALGVDVKEQARDHNTAVALELGVAAEFVVGSIAEVALEGPWAAPDIVVALHACDTATDEALARAIGWQAPLVLAAPCCHHDVARQLKAAASPAPYDLVTRFGILRERFADTLTDALRAALLEREGYRVEVMEFVESAHTPRNTLLRAVRGKRRPGDGAAAEALIEQWQLSPRLAELLS